MHNMNYRFGVKRKTHVKVRNKSLTRNNVTLPEPLSGPCTASASPAPAVAAVHAAALPRSPPDAGGTAGAAGHRKYPADGWTWPAVVRPGDVLGGLSRPAAGPRATL